MIYPNFVLKLARGSVDLLNADLRILLLSAAYTHDPAHASRNNIPNASVIAESAADLPSKSLALDVAGRALLLCEPLTFFAVPVGPPVTQAVLYVRSTTAPQSWLAAHYPALPGLPYAPSGGNAVFGFGASKRVLLLGDIAPLPPAPLPSGAGLDISTITANTAIPRTSARMFVIAQASAGVLTATLPTAAIAGDEVHLHAQITGLATAELACDPATSLNGVASVQLLSNYETLSVVYTGADWRIL